jgi:eukaryotic-like serine/threonine-protein kinase
MVDVGAAPIDRYVVLEHLSEGGMGAIYVGKKLGAGGFEMEVVLKQLLPEFTQQVEFIDLFVREAKLSATLDHANIVHTIDLVTYGGEYFIVMEYVPGGDLRTLLKKAKRRGKRFSPGAAIHICREVLSALAYAHVKRDFEGTPLKLIHRDVSPSNILVSNAGEVKLTDFGIAKAATHTSLFYKVKGKIGYMSPEQARSEPLDHRSDLYSLAVCLYEVLTGERLFVHAGLTTSADEIYSQPVPQISRKVPGLTPDLDAIMSKALALSPDARYQTASEFQEALTRCAHRNGLLMSAPEVARQLVELCGPPEQWRGEDDDDDLGYVQRAGTEIYDGGADDDEEEGRASSPSIHGVPMGGAGLPSPGGSARPGRPVLEGASSRMSALDGRSARPSPPALEGASARPSPPALEGASERLSSSRISRPRTEAARLQGVVELTSIINLIDLENQHREAMGERPLVDLEHGLEPPLDSGPQMELAPTTPHPQRARHPLPHPMPHRGQAQGQAPPVPVQAPPVQAPPALLQALAHDAAAQPVDPRDLLPTRPRTLPGAQPGPVPHFPAPVRRGSHGRARRLVQTWMVLVAIIVAAAVAGIVVAMSGPDVAVRSK